MSYQSKHRREGYQQKYLGLLELLAQGQTNVGKLSKKLSVSCKWVYDQINVNKNKKFVTEFPDVIKGYKLFKIYDAKERLRYDNSKAYLEREEPENNPTNKHEVKTTLSLDDIQKILEEAAKKKEDNKNG